MTADRGTIENMMKRIRRATVIVMIALAMLGVIITIPTTVHLAAASTYDRRIDVGSAQAVTDRDGNTWEPQTGFSGGIIESGTAFTPSALLDDAVARTALVGLPTHAWPMDLWAESTIHAVVPLAAADQQRMIQVVNFDVPVADHTLNMAFSPQANSLRLPTLTGPAEAPPGAITVPAGAFQRACGPTPTTTTS